MFLFKKYFAPLLFPLPVCLLLLGIGIVLLVRGRRLRLGKGAIFAGFGLLALASCGPVADACLGSLEHAYSVHQLDSLPAEVRWIVILGGGLSDDPALPANAQLSASSQLRLLEGMRLLQAYPGARLLLSGGSVFTVRSEADAMREVAALLGADRSRMVLEAASRDTEEQAVNVARYVGEEPFLLVTSAAHMRRSMRLFERQRLRPIAAPADFLVKQKQKADYRSWYPSSHNLGKTTTFIRENLGLAWVALRGKR